MLWGVKNFKNCKVTPLQLSTKEYFFHLPRIRTSQNREAKSFLVFISGFYGGHKFLIFFISVMLQEFLCGTK